MKDPQHINPGREVAAGCLEETIDDLYGRLGVTEVDLRDHWLRHLQEQVTLSRDGWYDPPPYGIGVLFGDERSGTPFRCSSLRAPTAWPSDRSIDWQHGIMYAYCSPIDLDTRLPSDFGVTLYFGTDARIRAHFATAISSTRQVLSYVEPLMRSYELLAMAEAFFDSNELRINVASVTDSVPVDLGHTLPRLDEAIGPDRFLSNDAKNAIRHGRLFISSSSNWVLSSAEQFTIEPNLVARNDPSLPQVSPHYVVAAPSDDDVRVAIDCELLLDRFGLLPESL